MTEWEICDWYCKNNPDFIILSEQLQNLILAENIMNEIADVEYYQNKIDNWLDCNMIKL